MHTQFLPEFRRTVRARRKSRLLSFFRLSRTACGLGHAGPGCRRGTLRARGSARGGSGAADPLLRRMSRHQPQYGLQSHGIICATLIARARMRSQVPRIDSPCQYAACAECRRTVHGDICGAQSVLLHVAHIRSPSAPRAVVVYYCRT